MVPMTTANFDGLLNNELVTHSVKDEIWLALRQREELWKLCSELVKESEQWHAFANIPISGFVRSVKQILVTAE